MKAAPIRPWPIIRLTYLPDGNFTLATGTSAERVVVVPEGLPRSQAAADAAADACLELGLERCRVQGYDQDGTVHELAVDSSTGELELQGNAGLAPSSHAQGLRGRLVVNKKVLSASVAVVCVAVTGTVLFVARDDGQHQVVTAVVSTPDPAQLPVLAPAGWDTYAAWSVPAERSAPKPLIGPEGEVLIAVEGHLSALNPETGAQLWSTGLGGAPRQLALTTVDKKTSIAVLTADSTLLIFTAKGTRTAAFDLERGAEISFDGASPLVTLPGQRAQIIVDGELRNRIIPAGAQALTADGGTVLAAQRQGTKFWSLTEDSPDLPDAETLKAPKGTVTGTVIGAPSGHLVTVWEPKKDSDNVVLSVDEISVGSVDRLLEEPVDSDSINRGDITSDPLTAQAVSGQVYFDFAAPSLSVVESGAGELGGGFLWSSDGDGGRLRTDSDGNSIPSPADAPIPAVVLDNANALVLEMAGGSTPTYYLLEQTKDEGQDQQ